MLYPTAEDLLAQRARYTYGTRGHPDDRTRWRPPGASLAERPAPWSCPPGLRRIALALLSCLGAGDHLLVTNSVYRPTRNFCDTVLKRFGVETTYYDPLIGAGIAALMRPNTRAVFTESPGSQSFEMQDIPAIAEAAHRRDAIVLMDNTWATPLFYSPHEHGADLAIEAGTKYLGGALRSAARPRLRERTLLEGAARNVRCDMAFCAGPEDVFLALRGLRTLARAADASSGIRARASRAGSAARPEVARVLHPALETDPGHAIWKRDFTGASSAVQRRPQAVAVPALHAFVDTLTLFGIGSSWGGFESLVIPFDCAPYRTATKWDPGGPAVRFHIGLEDVGDLIADLERGFAAMRAVV